MVNVICRYSRWLTRPRDNSSHTDSLSELRERRTCLVFVRDHVFISPRNIVTLFQCVRWYYNVIFLSYRRNKYSCGSETLFGHRTLYFLTHMFWWIKCSHEQKMRFTDIYGSCHGVWLIDDSTSNVTVELWIFRYFYLKVNISLDVLRFDSITALKYPETIKVTYLAQCVCVFQGYSVPRFSAVRESSGYC